MCGNESYAALAVEHDAYATAMEQRREREISRGTCGACSNFRPVPAEITNMEEAGEWGFCVDAGEYVGGDEAAGDSLCCGEAYEPSCWLERW